MDSLINPPDLCHTIWLCHPSLGKALKGVVVNRLTLWGKLVDTATSEALMHHQDIFLDGCSGMRHTGFAYPNTYSTVLTAWLLHIHASEAAVRGTSYSMTTCAMYTISTAENQIMHCQCKSYHSHLSSAVLGYDHGPPSWIHSGETVTMTAMSRMWRTREQHNKDKPAISAAAHSTLLWTGISAHKRFVFSELCEPWTSALLGENRKGRELTRRCCGECARFPRETCSKIHDSGYIPSWYLNTNPRQFRLGLSRPWSPLDSRIILQ